MTEQVSSDEVKTLTRRARGAAKEFPGMKFEDVLILSKGILQHGAGGRIRRLTLFEKIGKAPESGPSRQLVTASTRYGLITGGNQADFLAVTSDAEVVLANTSPEQEVRQKSFDLAIHQFDVFSKLYEGLKGKRLPALDVLKDEAEQVGIPKPDCQLAVGVFVANARYLKLVREMSGSERLLPIEQVVEEMAAAPKEPLAIPAKSEAAPIPEPRLEVPLTEPTVHIDIQIHINSSASPEQIDQVFASMARHLYRRDSR